MMIVGYRPTPDKSSKALLRHEREDVVVEVMIHTPLVAPQAPPFFSYEIQKSDNQYRASHQPLQKFGLCFMGSYEAMRNNRITKKQQQI